MDQNPRLSPHTIGVKYLDYISPIIVCGNFPLALKIGKCFNLSESTPYKILLIELSQKSTQILFIISNYKLVIWICSQSRIDVNSQSNLYDILTL